MADDWVEADSKKTSKKVVGKRFFPRDGNKRQNWRAENSPQQYTENWDEPQAIASWGGSFDTNKPKRNFTPRRQRKSDDKHITIEVPSSKVGRVIGRGGSKIRELKENNNADIIILNDVDENGMKKVKIIGAEIDVQTVQRLIDELVIDKPRYEETRNEYENQPAPVEQPNEPAVPEPEKPYEQIDWCAMAKKCQEETQKFWDSLPKINKNFYFEDPAVAKLTAKQVQTFREKNNNITVGYLFDEDAKKSDRKPIPNPVSTFAQCFNKYPEIMDNIRNMGFERPSPIQTQAWPILMSGQDMIGIAQTGTGKTLAFLLPALIHIEGQIVPRSERSGPTVLILAPTRELAQQIEKEVNKYSYKNIKAVCLYGGGNRRNQINVCSTGVEIVIATPGRLSDLTVGGHIDMKSVSYLVLDEADRMLDLGFEPQIRKILMDIRPNRQTVMTSATWPPGVRRLAQSYTSDPVQVCVGTLDLAAVHSVTQTVIPMEDDDDIKYNELVNFLTSMDQESKVIVFCGKKARVDHLSSELAMQGIDCSTIHGDLEQCDREQSLEDIASGRTQILIATDVASRGLDICDITHVINFDFPRNVEEYVHRVGRTGRAGRSGESITFITRGDWSNAKELISILEEANQSVPQELYDMSKRYDAFQKRRSEEKEKLRNYGRGNGGYRNGGGGGGGYSRSRW